jgi:solute:Na+ symporter, SSS family
MTEAQMLILGSIAVYFLAMIIIGILASRNQSHEGFVIGSRNVGYIPTIGSLASSFRDGMGVIFWFGFGASVGYGGIWMFFGVIAGLLVYAFIGSSARKIAAQYDYITIGEMIRARTGVITERFTALIIVCFALMIIAVQLHVAGNLFSIVLGMETWIGVTSVAAVVGFYLFFGGYSTVVKTDAVQFFIIISLLFTPLFIHPTEDMLNFSSVWSLETKTIIAFNLMGFFYVLSSADTWQRVFSARSTKVIYLGFPLAGISLLIITLSLIFLGMVSRPFLGEVIDTSTAFYEIFKGDFIATPIVAYIAVVVMAICMSTLDTMCYLTAATIAKNHMPPHITAKRENYVKFSQIVMLITLASMSILTLAIGDVLVFAFSAASLLFTLTPIYIFTVFNLPRHKSHTTDILITLSIAISCIVYLFMFFNGYFEDAIMTLVPVGISIILTSISLYIGGILAIRANLSA